MKRRFVVGAVVLAVILAAAAAGMAFGSSVLQVEAMTYQWTGEETQAEMEAMNRVSQMAWRLAETFPWVAQAAVLAGVAALALAARRAQLAGSASATASRVASSAASVSAGSAESIS